MSRSRDKVVVPAGFSPRLLRIDAAALYCGLSRGFFERHVGSIFPDPIDVAGVKLWDTKDLDAAIDAMKPSGKQSLHESGLVPFEV